MVATTARTLTCPSVCEISAAAKPSPSGSQTRAPIASGHASAAPPGALAERLALASPRSDLSDASRLTSSRGCAVYFKYASAPAPGALANHSEIARFSSRLSTHSALLRSKTHSDRSLTFRDQHRRVPRPHMAAEPVAFVGARAVRGHRSSVIQFVASFESGASRGTSKLDMGDDDA